MAEQEYTPTEGEIVTAVVTYRAIAGSQQAPPSIRDLATPEEAARYLAESHRWLAAHDADARAKRPDQEQVQQVADALESLAEMITDGLSVNDLYAHLHEHRATLLTSLALNPTPIAAPTLSESWAVFQQEHGRIMSTDAARREDRQIFVAGWNARGHAEAATQAPEVPVDAGPWQDTQGDVWTLGADGLLHTPETAPFPREHVEKKWGPLRPVAPTERHAR